MSAAAPYITFQFPDIPGYDSAIMEVNVIVVNPTDTTKTVNLLMTFDTGASISLAPRSLATQLGLIWDSGVPLKLSGVGGAIFDTYVHVLKAKILPILVNGHIITVRDMARARMQQIRPLLWRQSLQQQSALERDLSVTFDLPIAIAAGEDFELLLGMLGTINGVAEFRCDNVNRMLWFSEFLTKPYVFPSARQVRKRLSP